MATPVDSTGSKRVDGDLLCIACQHNRMQAPNSHKRHPMKDGISNGVQVTPSNPFARFARLMILQNKTTGRKLQLGVAEVYL
jgi:hypothetical protein